MNKSLAEISKYFIIPVLLPSVFTGFFPNKIVAVQALCYYLILYILWLKRKQWHKEEFDGGIIFKLVFFYSGLTYLRGFFNIDWYPDWINQFSGLVFLCFLMPMLLFVSSTLNLCKIYQGIIKFGIPLCVINALLPSSDGQMNFQHNMYFLLGFIFCIPYIKKKYRIFILLGLLVIVLYDIDRRSIFLNAGIAFFIFLFYQFIKSVALRKLLFYLFVLSPIILLFLGLFCDFNIFSNIGEEDSVELTEGGRAANVDSRTSIYLDVMLEIDKKKAYLFGLGGNGKTETSLSDNAYVDYGEIYKYGRPGTESGMLNNIQYGGIFGLLVYSLLFIVAAKRGVFNSNNEYMRMLGMFIAFKFLYSFIEDRLGAQASSFYLFLWIGMCYNKYFRCMTDFEIKQYFNQVFK